MALSRSGGVILAALDFILVELNRMGVHDGELVPAKVTQTVIAKRLHV